MQDFFSWILSLTKENYETPLTWKLLLIVNILKRIESSPALESLLTITNFHQWLQMCWLFLIIPSRTNLRSSLRSGRHDLHELHLSASWPGAESCIFWPKAYNTLAGVGKGQKKKRGIFPRLSSSCVGVFLLWEGSPTLMAIHFRLFTDGLATLHLEMVIVPSSP